MSSIEKPFNAQCVAEELRLECISLIPASTGLYECPEDFRGIPLSRHVLANEHDFPFGPHDSQAAGDVNLASVQIEFYIPSEYRDLWWDIPIPPVASSFLRFAEEAKGGFHRPSCDGD